MEQFLKSWTFTIGRAKIYPYVTALYVLAFAFIIWGAYFL